MHKRDAGFRVAPRAHPAFDGDRGFLWRGPGEDFAHAEIFSIHAIEICSKDDNLSSRSNDLSFLDCR
jgi:hypothetical protein